MIQTGAPFSQFSTLRSSTPRLQAYELYDLYSPQDDLFLEVRAGLSRTPKALSSKLFYDADGSALFEAICNLEEYYLTRTEILILEQAAAEIADWTGDAPLLIEYGSGSSRKTRILLDALQPVAYMPIDIARDALVLACEDLLLRYPDLMLYPVCADYTQPLHLPGAIGAHSNRRLAFFPGSTIGNFTPAEALHFLKMARRLIGEDGAMLIGVDLKKDPAILDAAYNDAKGVTAAFNLNLLAHLNRALGADFDLNAFMHRAFYNEAHDRVEMHLISQKSQDVVIQGHHFHFRNGESIHTENSCKYSKEEFQQLAMEAGFDPLQCWTDAEGLFSVHYLLS